MASGHGLIARSLLDRIPAEERAAAVRDAIHCLGQGSAAEVDLAYSLLREHPDDGLRKDLLKSLLSLLADGHVELVLSVCAKDAALRGDLLQDVTEQLAITVGRLQAGPKGAIAVAMTNIVSFADQASSSTAENNLEVDLASLRSKLTFVKRATSEDRNQHPPKQLLPVILISLGCSDEQTCLAARDALFAMLSTTYVSESILVAEEDLSLLWTVIANLASSKVAPFYQSLAYTIWLCWASSRGVPSSILLQQNYWHLLRQGLRDGDSERRKQCLGILRRSVAMAVADDRARHMVCSKEHASLDANAVFDQYERYCTVFETILLGRYLNQILECESDLDMLASRHSAVNPEWLETLLASALQPKIQDSVKKFVGGWIMRSTYQPGASDVLATFLKDSFLPWAAQGSRFTATLRKENGCLTCSHGERLASYISCLLQRAVEAAPGDTQLFDAVLDKLTTRSRGSFPYAAVYLLEGLGRAFETAPDMTLQPAQLAKLADISSSPAFPEVARDYLHVRCIKLCADSLSRSFTPIANGAAVNAARRWDELQTKLRSPGTQSSSEIASAVVSWKTEPSKRDLMEQRAVEKYQILRKRLEVADVAPAEAVSVLEDIWSDLEYLEYPKRLLIAMPALVLDARLARLAFASEELAEVVSDRVRMLQDLSKNRLYLLSPLVCAVRNLTLTIREADKLLPLENFVSHYAEHLPEASVDLQLEDASAQLLQQVAPELEKLGYEYYFGDRESLGIAALLDLVSRLSADPSSLAGSILDQLLQRWAKQKSPPPTVSPWKSTLQLQVMLLCCEQLSASMDSAEILQLLEDLHYVLSIEPLPRYRYLLSWMLARYYLRHEDLRPRILDELATKDHHSNPKYLASLMKIGIMVAKFDDSNTDFGLQLASTFVPLAASSKVVIRHEAQWQVPVLMDLARAKSWNAITDNSAFAALDDYIRSLERFDDPPLERQLDRLDPVKDHTLANLVEGSWFGLDSIETSTCGREDFIKLYKADTETPGSEAEGFPASCMPLGDPTSAPVSVRTIPDDGEETVPKANHPVLAPSKAGESRALQTKGTAYLASGLEDSAEQQARKRNDLIVVASLVDNPYNLGGLSRVSEIFGAAEMHLQNQNVTSNKDFTNVSVSSHLHFPICQLSASAVPAYLASQRDHGWSIVGIEQTDRSVLLGSAECKLPEKCVLVIGSEKEGIPALVLGECDMLVEIPQQGVTRSLNVQTAAGIVLFEYARQHQKAAS